jgi:DNA (cytosine-5)-methyltransferase 1
MKYISLFAGIGGFDLALDRLGHECVYTSEWDKHATKVYETRFNRPVDTRDIRTVQTEEIPEHDLLVGGFPCQAFSVAGKRLGFDDTRGTLFFEIARILKDRQPKYFILENVKGLLSHNSGQTFRTIVSTLTELGYDLQWNVLNSKNFGVPQNRERVYIVGHLRGQPRPKIFPITGKSCKIVRKKRNNISIADFRYDEGLRIRKDFISPTLTVGNGGNGLSQVNYLLDGLKIRRLTEIECERLQGFPDNWTETIPSTQRYKCLGNAVTVNVVYEVAKNL